MFTDITLSIVLGSFFRRKQRFVRAKLASFVKGDDTSTLHMTMKSAYT